MTLPTAISLSEHIHGDHRLLDTEQAAAVFMSGNARAFDPARARFLHWVTSSWICPNPVAAMGCLRSSPKC
jgi:hypothetical protein